MQTEELQAILDASSNKRQIERRLRREGYHDTRFYRPTKGKNLVRIAEACSVECEEKDAGKYWLFASMGVLDGYEWIWIEQTRKQPTRYSVSVWAKKQP